MSRFDLRQLSGLLIVFMCGLHPVIAAAVNSVRVESKTFAPGQVACTIQGTVLKEGDSTSAIAGSIVELWDSYPDGVVITTDTTDEAGHFSIVDAAGDLVARSKKYCPRVYMDVACDNSSQTYYLSQAPQSSPSSSPYFSDYYSVAATSEGYPIRPGSMVNATDPQGVACGTSLVTQDGVYLIHVLGDDPKTAEDEGAVAGDVITLWLNCGCSVIVLDTWGNGGSHQFDAAWDCGAPAQCCVLCEGWNMWSFNVHTSSSDRASVLETIASSYDAVSSSQCGAGTVSWFADRPANTLDEVEPWTGYDIDMLHEDTVCLKGPVINAQTPIPLCEGWNYIPYLPSEPDHLDHALESLTGHLSHVITIECGYGVRSWHESRGPQNNDLVCMESCKGYWINMTTADTLIYPTTPQTCGIEGMIAAGWSTATVAPSPMVADYYSPFSDLAMGSVISAHGASGTLIGETTVGAEGAFLLHVYGDVPQTSRIEGAVEGELLSFEIDGQSASPDRSIPWTNRDNQTIELSINRSSAIPTEYALLQNYPNPFNAGTVMTFDLKEETRWTLRVYNVIGQAVREFSGRDVAGRIRVPWNGRNDDGSEIASGIYFYRVEANNFTATKKMIMVK